VALNKAAASRRRPRLGGLALAFYAIHASTHLRLGQPEHLLWACHLAVVLVAGGLLSGSPTWNAIGLSWILVGDALWLLDLASGAELLPTSPLTHVGGLVLAVIGVRSLGMPKGVWWQAALLLAALQLATRLLTPAEANVNVAFRVWSGWEEVFPSYRRYLASSYAILLAVFLVIERATRRLLAADRTSG
jgi:hypothetical protein